MTEEEARDEARMIGQKHREAGDFLSYPQPETWTEYKGMKYCVTIGPKMAVGRLHKTDGRVVVQWTPYYSIAESIADKLRHSGWKYREASAVELNSRLLKDENWHSSTFAGFSPFSLMRKDSKVVIIPESPIAKALATGYNVNG